MSTASVPHVLPYAQCMQHAVTLTRTYYGQGARPFVQYDAECSCGWRGPSSEAAMRAAGAAGAHLMAARWDEVPA